jgi:hypothetical protein
MGEGGIDSYRRNRSHQEFFSEKFLPIEVYVYLKECVIFTTLIIYLIILLTGGGGLNIIS